MFISFRQDNKLTLIPRARSAVGLLIWRLSWTLSARVNRLGREVDHWPPPGFEIKKIASTTLLSQHAFLAWTETVVPECYTGSIRWSLFLFSYPKFVYLTQQSTPFDFSCLGRQTLPKLCGFKLRSVDRKCITCIIYNKPTRCNSGSIVFINNYKYALHVSDSLCVHHQEHYKL